MFVDNIYTEVTENVLSCVLFFYRFLWTNAQFRQK